MSLIEILLALILLVLLIGAGGVFGLLVFLLVIAVIAAACVGLYLGGVALGINLTTALLTGGFIVAALLIAYDMWHIKKSDAATKPASENSDRQRQQDADNAVPAKEQARRTARAAELANQTEQASREHVQKEAATRYEEAATRKAEAQKCEIERLQEEETLLREKFKRELSLDIDVTDDPNVGAAIDRANRSGWGREASLEVAAEKKAAIARRHALARWDGDLERKAAEQQTAAEASMDVNAQLAAAKARHLANKDRN